MSNNFEANWDILWKRHPISKRVAHYNILSLSEIKRYINLSGIDIIEVGCGTGQLSLLLSQEAKSITLLDFSENSLKIPKKLFEMYNRSNCSFILDDLFDLHHNRKYDLVVSSGLLEHFKDKRQVACLNAHKYLAKKGGYVAVIVPSDTWFNAKRCCDPDNIRLYGYWRPVGKVKMLQLFNDTGLSPLVIKRFDLFYGLKPRIIVELVDLLNSKVNFPIRMHFFDRLFGGLIMGIGKNEGI